MKITQNLKSRETYVFKMSLFLPKKHPKSNENLKSRETYVFKSCKSNENLKSRETYFFKLFGKKICPEMTLKNSQIIFLNIFAKKSMKLKKIEKVENM